MFSSTKLFISRRTLKSCSDYSSRQCLQQQQSTMTTTRSLVAPSSSFQRRKTSSPQEKATSITAGNNNNNNRQHFSSWTGRGHDFFTDSFLMGDRPKVLLEAIAPSGFDVSNLLKKIDPNEVAPHGALHMMGSILAFPHSCFLWKTIEEPSDITIESLAPIMLHRPKIEFLFIGTAKPMHQPHLEQLKKEMKEQADIVVEWLPLSEAMATFNILNGEDRMVATALVLDKDESNYVKDQLEDLA